MVRAAALALLAALTAAQTGDDSFWAPGSVGSGSCALWLSNATQRTHGEQWLLGLWAGLNAGSPKTHLTGQTTDAAGLIGEVKLVCQQEPSITLMSATFKVYYRFVTQQR